MTDIYLSLGTNIGDRYKNLTIAIKNLSEVATITKQSSLYETEPYGKIDQNSFYNMMIEIETDLSANKLLEECLYIEKKMGRIKIKKWGPRLIDIDLIAYSSKKICSKNLIVPHPEFHKRKFVLEAFAEIAPDFKIENDTVITYLRKCIDKSNVKRLFLSASKQTV